MTKLNYAHITPEEYFSHFRRLSAIVDSFHTHRTPRICSQFRWQTSFHDHVLRDERDYYTHLHYLWKNPVKHGLVSSPHHWKHLWVEGRSRTGPGHDNSA